MAFFSNSAVNLLNLHYALHQLAVAGGGAFFFAYLLKQGLTPSATLVVLAVILLGRLIIRPLIVGLALRFGLRGLVIAGTLLTAMQYPLLAEVRENGLALWALMALSAIGDMVYWTSYHAYCAAIGDDHARGRQVSAREASVALITAASPMLTGWLLTTSGPHAAFAVSGIVAALSTLPLWWAPNIQVAPKVDWNLNRIRTGVVLFAADGWTAASYAFVWQIALFRTLGESYIAYGSAMALAALAAAIASLWLGGTIDDGKGKRAVVVAAALFAAVIVLRAAAVGGIGGSLAANAAGALVAALFVPVLMTQVYTMSKNSACPLRFHVAAEGGWDVGGASGALTAATLLWLGAPIEAAILMALPGLGLMAVLTRGYYAQQSARTNRRYEGAGL